jgi:hypothetical protein
MVRVLLIWGGIFGAVVIYQLTRPGPASLSTAVPDRVNMGQ